MRGVGETYATHNSPSGVLNAALGRTHMARGRRRTGTYTASSFVDVSIDIHCVSMGLVGAVLLALVAYVSVY